jgi:hypothetical protein
MSGIISLLIEISALLETVDAAWTDDIKVSTCKLMQQMLSDTCIATSFVIHDSDSADCVSICLGMAQTARQANDDLEFSKTLRAKLQTLTSKCMCIALHANRRAALRRAVDDDTARHSLLQQLQL